MLDFKRGGYGMGAERIPVGQLRGYGHSGLLRGFTSLLVHLPDQDVTLVVMGTTNLFDPALVLAHRDAGRHSILDLALRAAGAEGRRLGPSSSGNRMSRMTGIDGVPCASTDSRKGR